MSKDVLDKAADAVKKTSDNIKDTLHEGGHRASAEAEKSRRDAVGDTMSSGEKLKSVANEAKHRAQAEYDATKRDVRNTT